MQRVSYQRFLHENGDDSSLSDNIVYDIAEDNQYSHLWVGTRSGLSILKLDEPDAFINYKSGKQIIVFLLTRLTRLCVMLRGICG